MKHIELSRRSFLKSSAALSGGLMVGFAIPAGPAAAAGLVHTPNAWVHIADDNSITLISARAEMGQGVFTSMPMLLAEELNVDLRKVKVAFAPPGKAYGNAMIFGLQLTGGSTSVREGWERQRLAGAQVREMLIAAAAERWKVDASTLRAEDGRVLGPKGRRATYGQLAADAAKLKAPEKVALKDPSQFRIVGKRTPRLDTPAKVNGTARFGIDVKLPGMVYASLAQCPVQGGKVKFFDATKARAMPGVIDVVQIPDGVAVVAQGYWQAAQARDQLVIEWDEGPNAGLNTAAMVEGTRSALANGKPFPVKKQGDADALIAQATAQGGKLLRAEYVTQNLSHAPMEPMNYTADVRADRALLVGPTQWPDALQGAIAKIVGLDPKTVTVENTFLGGGFGRRIDFDYAIQAALISQAVGKPVKLVWTREDDMQHDFYRPLGVHQLAAAIGSDGKPTALTWRVASQSVTGRVFNLPADAPDGLMIEAAVPLYDIPAARHDAVKHDAGLRVGYWRAVSHNMNTFANESFIDELAAAAGKDPVAYRLSLLETQPRLANVLKTLAAKAGWGTPAAAGRYRGVAVFEGYETHIGAVLEISMKDGAPQVHRVTVVADPGRMVNPDTVEAQIQSSVVYGLSAALWGEITVDKGRVQQFNFDSYRVMRHNEVPAIDITLIESREKPGGIGEPATSLMAPALANAVFAATGKRVRRTPIRPETIAQA
ncbi:MAG TPA: xanthine dehydrogenase family protein molybdopterin-binding subunit [Burkholderiaceae bacterium]|nr:xanthine dehydrogenase family protein molybdopterin-binding subunit [Burkholderiaceae bacterium]HMX09481.1 xanthine dehydrogenase family protein molybdopterin-binding subunit [Burkholderiaceae bacterium]HMY98459.1 xanthine dehydrogenase family protein molybdopterin-binding subunit [Burkholderiaceae bacterium]